MKGLENGQLFCLYHQGVSLEAFVKNAKNSLTYLKVEIRAIQAFLKFFVPVQNEKILRKFLAKVIPLGPLWALSLRGPGGRFIKRSRPKELVKGILKVIQLCCLKPMFKRVLCSV